MMLNYVSTVQKPFSNQDRAPSSRSATLEVRQLQCELKPTNLIHHTRRELIITVTLFLPSLALKCQLVTDKDITCKTSKVQQLSVEQPGNPVVNPPVKLHMLCRPSYEYASCPIRNRKLLHLMYKITHCNHLLCPSLCSPCQEHFSRTEHPL